LQTQEIIKIFKAKGLKATPQRIAVYKFLAENPIHPDVETVYREMIKENPCFSKTTVYNCLQALTDCELLIPVKIDNDKIRYDADTSFHGHFICEKCKEIFDFACKAETDSVIDDFVINQRDVYYSGICSRCRNN